MKSMMNLLFAAARHFGETAAICGILGAGSITLATIANGQTTKPFFPLAAPVVSTVPSNGDVNPYGVFFVPRSIPTDGTLQPGDILVSNFNNNQNLQDRLDHHPSRHPRQYLDVLPRPSGSGFDRRSRGNAPGTGLRRQHSDQRWHLRDG